MQRSDTVKEEGTAGGELDGEEVDGKGKEVYKAERNISPFESEAVRPTEITLPNPVFTEPDVVPAVHRGVSCDGCGVCTSLRSDCFRRWSDYYGLGFFRKRPLQARVGTVSSAMTMIYVASAIRQLTTITAC